MVKRRMAVLAHFLLIVFIAGCSRPPARASGNDIVLTYATGPVLSGAQELDVFMTNTSKACIDFPDDFGLKIYYEKNGRWVESGNLITYLPGQHNRLTSHGDPLDTTSIALKPDLSHVDIGESLAFKATIQGHICDDATIVVEKEIPFSVIPGR